MRQRVPGVVWALVLARAVNRLGAFTLPFLTVLLTRRLGASITDAGLLLALFGVATIPSRLAGGQLADRLGRRTTIALGLTGCAAGQLAVAAAQTLTQAAVAVAFLGLVFEVYEPPSQAMVADVVAPRDRPAAYGLLAAAMAAAGVASGLLAVVLGGIDLRLLFVVDAATCLAAAAVVLRMLPRRTTIAAVETGAPGAWRDGLLLAMLAAGTVFATVYLQVLLMLPVTVADRLHDPSLAGLLLAVSALTVVLSRPLLRVLRRPVIALVTGYLLLAAGLGAYAVTSTLAGFVAATVVWSAGDVLLLGRTYALVADLAPPGARGRYLSVYGVSWGLAGVVAPLLGTQLLSRLGTTGLWSSAGVTCVVLAALQPLLMAKIRKRRGVMTET
jgi:MFS family permease